MGDNLNLLGALVALRVLSLDDAEQVVAFCRYADDADLAPTTVTGAVDRALDFFNEDPNTEEAHEVARRVAVGRCCECGEPLEDDELTDDDFQMAVDLWLMAREMVRMRDGVVTPDEDDD